MTTQRVFWYCILVALGKNMNFGGFAIVCDFICSKTKLPLRRLFWLQAMQKIYSTVKLLGNLWTVLAFIYLNLNYLYNSSNRDRASKNRHNAWWIYLIYTFLHSLTSLHIKPNRVPRTAWAVGKIGSSLPADAGETTHARQSHNNLKVQNASTSFCWYRWG